MPITDILANNAKQYGEETALIERDPVLGSRRTITWRKFDQQANQVAQALLKKGIQKNDKVVLLLMNSLEWLPIYFGILRTGAWVVPLNFRFSAEEIAYCTQLAEARAFIFGDAFIDRVAAVKATLDQTVTAYIFVGPAEMRPDYAQAFPSFLLSGDPKAPGIEIVASDSAGLYFTSGTTGRPKAVHLTHRNLEFACQ